MTVVDTHTHFIPLEFVDYLRSGEGPADVTVVDRDGRDPLISHSNGLAYPVFPLFHDARAKLDQMDSDGIDVSLCSIAPSLFLYDADPAETLRAHRVINDAGAAYAAASGGRIAVLATVPLNDPAAAAGELRRACGELGLCGVEIGPSVGNAMIDSPDFEPLLAAAEELDVTVMLHPYLNMVAKPGPDLEGFHLSNVVGNPFETAVAASRLIVGGVFDRHPALRVQLSHAGGAFPYQLGRLQHAYGAREETKSVARSEPYAYLEHFLFDTVIFDERALRFLLDMAGPEAVVFGTDLPFDMADVSAAEALPRVTTPETAAKVLGGNALRAYRVPDPVSEI
ncbi:MAG TPA: amidohydrolase family protein [Thermoleophilaceae bacterium]|nr:amidohydrolase family protein [Thermoleophilaceae bacterium]